MPPIMPPGLGIYGAVMDPRTRAAGRMELLSGIGGGGAMPGGLDISGALNTGLAAAQEDDDAIESDIGMSAGADDIHPGLVEMARGMMDDEPLSKEDKGLALAKMGFGIAAGQSPHALSNIGAGVVGGIDDIQKIRQQRALQRMREAQMEQAAAYRQAVLGSRMSPVARLQKDRENLLASGAAPDDPRVLEINAAIEKATTKDAGESPVFQKQIDALMAANPNMTRKEATNAVLLESQERTNRPQQGGLFRLPNGQSVPAMFNPETRRYEYRDEKGNLIALPFDAQPTTPSIGSPLNRRDFEKKQNDFLTETEGLRKMDKYLGTVESAEQGWKLAADKFTASVKTLMDSGDLTPEEFATVEGQAKLQALLGANRIDVVGPGVMTEYDAQRVLAALGGDATKWRNKEVVADVLGDIYETKRRRAEQYRDQLIYSAPAYGKTLDDFVIPEPVNFRRTVNNAPPNPKDGTVVTDVEPPAAPKPFDMNLYKKKYGGS